MDRPYEARTTRVTVVPQGEALVAAGAEQKSMEFYQSDIDAIRLLQVKHGEAYGRPTREPRLAANLDVDAAESKGGA